MPEVPLDERSPESERPKEASSAPAWPEAPPPASDAASTDSGGDDPASTVSAESADGADPSESRTDPNDSLLLTSTPREALPAPPAHAEPFEGLYPRSTASRDAHDPLDRRPYGMSRPIAHEAPEGAFRPLDPPRGWQPEATAARWDAPLGGMGEPRFEGVGYGEGTLGAPPVERRRGRTLVRGLREVAETIILALLIFLLVRAVVQNFQVEGSSMEPTLHTGWYLLVNKAVYFEINLETIHKFVPFIDPGDDPTRYVFRAPKRGDIIVFEAPNQVVGQPERDFIKRIIAVPGETVEVRDQAVFINGQPLDEAYIQEQPNYTFAPQTVPEGRYFVLGDNRNNSSDSHVWPDPFLPKENIIGRAWVTYWPFSALGFVNNTSVEPGSGLPQEPAKVPSAASP